MRIDIQTLGDVAKARQRNSWLNRPFVDSIRIRVPGMTADELAVEERQVRALFNDCGCHYGAVSLVMVALVLTLACAFAASLSWASLLWIVPSAVLVSVVAKFVALRRSKRRLDARLADLTPRFLGAAAPAPISPNGASPSGSRVGSTVPRSSRNP